MISYSKHVFSPMNLPGTKPDWSKSSIVFKTVLHLLVIDPAAILYEVFKRVMGLQFFKKCLSLSAFNLLGK
jgi:hypothetical protein